MTKVVNNVSQKSWRQCKRDARNHLSAADKTEKSRLITQTLLQSTAYQQAKYLAAYLCLPEEVNVQAVIERAWQDGKAVYLPVVMSWGKALQFAPYTADTPLCKDVLAIDIPAVAVDSYIDATQLDMVVTPLVAFDEQCNRIGMGGGFYDRTFAFKARHPQTAPTLIGVAFEVQRTDTPIDCNAWDIRPNSIISEHQVYQHQGLAKPSN